MSLGGTHSPKRLRWEERPEGELANPPARRGPGCPYLAGRKQVAALDGFENVGRDVGLGRKVGLCQGLLHFLHVDETQGPLFS